MLENSAGRLFFLGLAFAFIIVTLLLALKSLPYSTASISHFSIEEASRQPNSAQNFSVGDIKWNVEQYRTAPELDSFRSFFEINCKGLKGLDASICLSDKFLKAIPFGEPETEMYMSNYSPAEDLEKHLKGLPGHCVTYSALTATTLLSVGIPARVTQIIPGSTNGHNVIEVWDEKNGWILFDALSGSAVSDDKHLVSAFESLETSKTLHRVRAENKEDSNGYLKEYYKDETVFSGAIIYPEPYLYTRVGEKQSLPFFRGKFAGFGKNFYFLGTAQNILLGGIIISCLAFLWLAASIINYCHFPSKQKGLMFGAQPINRFAQIAFNTHNKRSKRLKIYSNNEANQQSEIVSPTN